MGGSASCSCSRTNADHQVTAAIVIPSGAEAGCTRFERPSAVDFDMQGNIIVVEAGANRLQVLGQDGTHLATLGGTDQNSGIQLVDDSGGPLHLSEPQGVAVDPVYGTLAISDKNNHRVVMLRPNGAFVALIGRKGVKAGQFKYPHGIAVDFKGAHLIVADAGNHRVQVFSFEEGTHIRTIGSKGIR